MIDPTKQRWTIHRPGQAPQVLDARDPAEAAEALLSRSRHRCERDILAVAPIYRQLNAANGLLSPEEISEVVEHISACRAANDAREASVRAILDSTELDNVGKLAAMDALGS